MDALASAPPVPAGSLAIVLHTHMPYVEGFGTWPFGEEWLFEAAATAWIPLLDVLDPRIALSVTPVLADQLEAPRVAERLRAFLEELRPETHALDREHYRDEPDALRALADSERHYADAAARLRELGGDLLSGLMPHAAWTSAATHPILPLLGHDESIEVQLRTGIAAHRRRSGGTWAGGFWLPECAYAPWLAVHLEEAGIHHACIELADVDPRRPLATAAGTWLWPIDRPIIDLVWGRNGYPSRPEYRAREGYTPRRHQLWANDGGFYDPVRAAAAVRRDAAEFVRAVVDRIADGGVCVFAIDTELLGHWWHEGAAWLGAVITEADRAGLTLVRPEDAAITPAPMPELTRPISWGEGGDLRTWSAGPAADLAHRLRSAEIRARVRRLAPRAERELLAAQSSDWAFLEYRGWAGSYARERAEGHLAALDDALAGRLTEPALRGLAPDLVPA